MNKYSTLSSTSCHAYYVKGQLQAEVTVEMDIQTGDDPTGAALRDFNSEKSSGSSVYGPAINVNGIGQQAVGFKSSSSALHIYVLDGNMVTHVEYFAVGGDSSNATNQDDAHQKGITDLARSTLNRTV
ncbi:hypothetical protein [Fodinicola feengrottensis]|uniref:hypothetical protein n=1 Tax=Fodinicola feengrottensis TaxID=435914 RepID=UPI0013D49427|nr:hypothetical protein [Fodinicola feengrottensis]